MPLVPNFGASQPKKTTQEAYEEAQQRNLDQITERLDEIVSLYTYVDGLINDLNDWTNVAEHVKQNIKDYNLRRGEGLDFTLISHTMVSKHLMLIRDRIKSMISNKDVKEEFDEKVTKVINIKRRKRSLWNRKNT